MDLGGTFQIEGIARASNVSCHRVFLKHFHATWNKRRSLMQEEENIPKVYT